ncbi:hypothetical protein [Acidiphilium rubrum]|uniref:hypothetical protein n=1 Tax=Acidiphilium rubrum TaxID=526 RepID=UPI001C37884F|nr:hypothetical protein [Acidiphilium rubrum]
MTTNATAWFNLFIRFNSLIHPTDAIPHQRHHNADQEAFGGAGDWSLRGRMYGDQALPELD